MAGETLKTTAQLLAAWPDNQAGLIESVDGRDFIISGSAAVGFLEPVDTPTLIPMTAGVPQDIFDQFVAPQFFGNFWQLDGNNHFIPDYTGQGINVPAGVTRLLNAQLVMVLSKAGGGTATYTFQSTADGIPIGAPTDREITAVQETYVFSSVGLYAADLGPAISVQVTPVTGDDLTVHDLRSSVASAMI